MKRGNLNSMLGMICFVCGLQSCNNDTQPSTNNQRINVEHRQAQEENIKVSDPIESKKAPKDFIPKGYVLHSFKGEIFEEGFDEIKGDLNKDGLEDRVLIVKGTEKSKFVKDEYRGKLDRNRRGIIVLFNKGGTYELASKNLDCFSSENEDGGVYFAPELNVAIDKGNLNISYGHGRYGNWSYTFRYQNGGMALIGYDLYSFRGPVSQYELSVNFLTKKKLIRDNLNKEAEDGDYNVKYAETWETIEVNKLMDLSEVEDFDELYFER